jgi:membrane associated rhomboid family serine protease
VQSKEPIFNVPASVVAVVGLIVAVHLVRAALPDALDNWLVGALAFIPARETGLANDLPGGLLTAFTSFLTHMLVHGDITHLMFNSAWMLAFGGAIAQRVAGPRFLAFALFCGVCGVACFWALNYDRLVPVVGASGAIAGLMGGTFRYLFSAMDQGGVWRLGTVPWTVPVMPLAVALRDKRIIAATAIWIGLNVLAILGVGTAGDGRHRLGGARRRLSGRPDGFRPVRQARPTVAAGGSGATAALIAGRQSGRL